MKRARLLIIATITLLSGQTHDDRQPAGLSGRFDLIRSVTVLQPLEAMRVTPSAQIPENRFISKGIGYANFHGRSHNAVIGVCHDAVNVKRTRTLAILKSGEFTCSVAPDGKRGLPQYSL